MKLFGGRLFSNQNSIQNWFSFWNADLLKSNVNNEYIERCGNKDISERYAHH